MSPASGNAPFLALTLADQPLTGPPNLRIIWGGPQGKWITAEFRPTMVSPNLELCLF